MKMRQYIVFGAWSLSRLKVFVISTLLLFSFSPSLLFGQAKLDSIRTLLEHAPIQEKVYLHLDNNCYFKGDTIWYKSYVVRADNLGYTDMSHILYVELLSPDGLVVERQNIIVSPDGYGDGNFALKDSLYSGYYELRAYTRWMLNFRVTEHPYGRKDREYFYNKEMASDFFRQFGTVYSRVVPVYERPDSAGDYAQKYIVSRPKTRIEKEQKEDLLVNFYPEGGHLIAGTRCRVAFEVHDEEGQQIDIEGAVRIPNRSDSLRIRTTHQGRGVFTVDVPTDGRLRARFTYHGKDYRFDLPKAEDVGCALRLDATGSELTAEIEPHGFAAGSSFAVAVLCRGVLKYFQTLTNSPQQGNHTSHLIDASLLPTGVNNLIVLDEDGRLLADRLFFVNHHDFDLNPVSVSGFQSEYQPFEAVTLQFQAPAAMKHLSISVRDGANEELTYDTGSIMTDLLLSSELKGFVAYPDYYFEADDAEHRQALDLLMMVQGWRRYDFTEITNGERLRYEPEQYMTVEGSVWPVGDSDEIYPDEVRYWPMGIFGYNPSLEMANDTDIVDQEKGSEMVSGMNRYEATTPDDLVTQQQEGTIQVEQVGTAIYVQDPEQPTSAFDPFFGVDNKGLHKPVTLEGELVFPDDIATVKMETDATGHFVFNIPAYYGQAILFLRASKTNLSEEKRQKKLNKGMLDETAWPDFYVKRDLFFPVFAKKYDYYQCHVPQISSGTAFDDYTLPDTARLSKMDATLKEVKVKGRRRHGRHAIDYSKPAYVYDAVDLYNLVTDRGLSFGRFEARKFPMQIAYALLGNYNSERALQVAARINDQELTPYVFYRNFDPGPTVMEQFRSDMWVFERIKLNRQNEIRLFTDFELRNEDRPVPMQSTVADVTLDYMLLPDDSKRYTYRDRRIILDGMYEPADFYHPDYSHMTPSQKVNDYRRTLYWNPNARLDADGRFTATFYNNAKPTRIKVTTAGIPSF